MNLNKLIPHPSQTKQQNKNMPTPSQKIFFFANFQLVRSNLLIKQPFQIYLIDYLLYWYGFSSILRKTMFRRC
jgi:hypothetical protein